MEYSDRAEQEAYANGFADGQLDIIELFDECVDNADGRTEAFEMFRNVLEEIRKDIESL